MSGRSPRQDRICRRIAPRKFAWNFLPGSAAGTRVMPRLVTRPKSASPIRITRGQPGLGPEMGRTSRQRRGMPRMMAMKVPSSSRPLPHDNFCSGSSSGSSPYLDGPKNALCTPIRKTQPSNGQHVSQDAAMPGCNCHCLHTKPASASSITHISKIFHADGHRPFAATVGEKSARHGKQNERQRKQRHDQFAKLDASRRGTCPCPTSRNTTRFFRTLSLNAPWNCVTMRLQKPRRLDSDCRLMSLGSVTAAKLTTCAPNCELKNFCPASFAAMGRKKSRN